MRIFLQLAFVVGIACAACTSRVRAQNSTTPPEYESVVRQAVAEFSEGRWPEARALFLRAEQLFPNARAQRGVGMASFEMGDYPEALRALAASLANTTLALTNEQRTQVASLLERARSFVGRYSVAPVNPSARFYVDGERVELEGGWPAQQGFVVLSVGAHQVTVRDDQNHVATARIVVRGGENAELDIDLAAVSPTAPAAIAPQIVPVRPPSTRPESVRLEPLTPRAPSAQTTHAPGTSTSSNTGAWVLTGISGAVAIAGAVLVAVGAEDIRKVNTARAGTEWATLETAHDRAPILTGIGIPSLVLGVAGAAGGVIWALTSNSSSASGSAPQITVRAGLTSIAVGGQW